MSVHITEENMLLLNNIDLANDTAVINLGTLCPKQIPLFNKKMLHECSGPWRQPLKAGDSKMAIKAGSKDSLSLWLGSGCIFNLRGMLWVCV